MKGTDFGLLGIGVIIVLCVIWMHREPFDLDLTTHYHSQNDVNDPFACANSSHPSSAGQAGYWTSSGLADPIISGVPLGARRQSHNSNMLRS